MAFFVLQTQIILSTSTGDKILLTSLFNVNFNILRLYRIINLL